MTSLVYRVCLVRPAADGRTALRGRLDAGAAVGSWIDHRRGRRGDTRQAGQRLGRHASVATVAVRKPSRFQRHAEAGSDTPAPDAAQCIDCTGGIGRGLTVPTTGTQAAEPQARLQSRTDARILAGWKLHLNNLSNTGGRAVTKGRLGSQYERDPYGIAGRQRHIAIAKQPPVIPVRRA